MSTAGDVLEMAPMARLAIVALVLSAGCRVFDESLLDDVDGGPRDAGSIDAGSDAGDGGGLDASHDAGPACPLFRPPPRPSVDDGPSVDEVVFALEGIDLDQGDGWSTIGYDLDGLCSLLPDPEVECYPPAASSVPEVDGESGIDNAFGHQVLPLLLVARPDFAEQAVRDQHDGISTFVIRIRGWNGTADDPLVDVMLATSEFGTPGLDDGGAPSPMIPDGALPTYGDGGVPPGPRWDGNDYWWLRRQSFFAGDLETPRIHDDTAWIADGTLVMRMQDRVPIVLTGGYRSTVFLFTNGLLTAELSEDFQRVDRAVVAGRWSLADLLETAEYTAICPGTSNYASFARLLDLTADVRATPGTGGPTAVCDAISVGFTLFGTRAKIGGLSDRLGTPNACADAGVSDGGP